MLVWWICIGSVIVLARSQNLTLISKTRSAFLEKYKDYSDVIIMHFRIPTDVSFVSLKFVGDEMDLSIFGCTPKSVTLYMKYGAPPVINPDGSKFPENFYLEGRPEMTLLEFKSDTTFQYINMSTPFPGSYYAAVFQTYTDPKNEGITQDGLTPECYTYIDAALYSAKPNVIDIVTNENSFTIQLDINTEQAYKFYVPESIDHVLLTLTDVTFCNSCLKLITRIQADNVPTKNNSLGSFGLTPENKTTPYFYRFWSQENSWHYIAFQFESNDENSVQQSSITFSFKYFSSAVIVSKNDKSNSLQDLRTNYLDSSKKAKFKSYRTDSFLIGRPYKQYDLLRDSSTESFKYSFDIELKKEGEPPIAVNVTNKDFTVLKFKIQDSVDSGGTMQFIIAFKPRVTKEGNKNVKEKEPSNHLVIGCISNAKKEIPMWPNNCWYNDKEEETPLILNSTTTNTSVLIPFPESGTWFVSLKLFCGDCEPCDCPEQCKTEFKVCVTNCEQDCLNIEDCNACTSKCEESTLNSVECSGCDCDGPCKKTDVSCNTSLIFHIGSDVCVNGKCGQNGRCTFMVAEGFVYTTCICFNNYRGWDCSDDSNANSYFMVVLELLLLVLSNLAFLPACYIAIRRKYYIEALAYFSTCFFSTFYHSCDAGENIISFCIVRLAVLQFSDFYCGLLSIWVTLIAMAHIESGTWKYILHMLGAIILSFGTTYNKTSLWVFLLPAIVGVLIVCICWYLRYRETKKIFPNKIYLRYFLPAGLVVVGVGLISYALLQTKNNYKYVHSAWHISMAIGIMVLLPCSKYFLPNSDNTE